MQMAHLEAQCRTIWATKSNSEQQSCGKEEMHAEELPSRHHFDYLLIYCTCVLSVAEINIVVSHGQGMQLNMLTFGP